MRPRIPGKPWPKVEQILAERARPDHIDDINVGRSGVSLKQPQALG
jgi:hypothetical protein